MATWIGINNGSENDLLPDGTKPLIEPMLICRRWGSVAVPGQQFHWNKLSSQTEFKMHTFNSLRPSDSYIIGSDNGLSPGQRQAII